MGIPKLTEISSFDANQLPNLQSQINSIFKNGGAVKYVKEIPTIDNVSENEFVIYDPDRTATSKKRLYFITAQKHLCFLELGTVANDGVDPQPEVPADVYPFLQAIMDNDFDTYVHTEASSDEDIVRVNTGNTQGGTAGERATFDNNGFAVTAGLRVGLDGRTAGSYYWKYNSSNSYMEAYVNGVIRMQM